MSDGWHDDPLGRYPKRYYDGTQWTHHVADASGATQVDPYGTQPSPGGMPSAPPVSQMPPQPGVAGFSALPGNPILRFIARLIDALIIGLPLVLLLEAVGIGGFEFDFSEEAAADSNQFPVAALIIQVAVFAAYEIYMIGTFGRTIGKMVCGLTVVRRKDAGLPGYGVATVRYIAGIVYAVPFIGWILFIVTVVMGFSDALRQTIHDKIATTVVAKSSSLKS
ncbi:MAG: RDD family protein [Acidimicrobiales bacterium]